MAGRDGHAGAPLQARTPAHQGRQEHQARLSQAAPPAEVQVFGRRDSRDTQKALRFFRERRIRVVFVDLGAKPIAPTELRRFSERFGASALIDTTARAYRDAGLGYLTMDDDAAVEKLMRDQRLIRLPLVRAGSRLSIGPAESDWRAWLRAADQ